MNVLIIGLGFVGNRFLQAFKNVSEVSQSMAHISFAYVDKRHKTRDIPYFDDVEAALSVFKPHIVVVAVNDEVHGEILAKLKGFSGFLICEKPLIGPREDAQRAIVELSGISGFAFDLTARYSAAVTTLKSYVATHGLQLIRGNFYWGKDRINDYRPTCGVISEIIHPLDLVRHICNPSQEIQLRGVLGTRSDFSVSGNEVLDSVAISAHLGSAAITGYSSFVNITRKREVDLTFLSTEGELVYASLVFDVPTWDIDNLRIWQQSILGEKILVKMNTEAAESQQKMKTIMRLECLVSDVVGYVWDKHAPSQPFADLATALSLQNLLNAIERDAKTLGPVQYVISKREFVNNEVDLERLG